MTSIDIKNSIIGFGCSAAATFAIYPIETLAHQYHVTDKRTTLRQLIQGIRGRGLAQGYYKGVTSALVTQPMYWALYMPVYERLKRVAPDSGAAKMASAWTAGAVATIATNPLWVVRQRMQTEVIKGKQHTYASLARELWHENGAKTFLRGANITLVKNVQMAFLLPLFEHWTAGDTHGLLQTAMYAAAAKAVSSTVVYPLDIIRTNVRYNEGKHIRWLDVTRQLVQRPGGYANLFRGIHLYWLSTSTMFAVMMSLKVAVSDL